MTQRRCPKCENGVMSDMYTARGWGKEGFYACDSCAHTKNIYEGRTMGPYIIFIFFEMVLFFLSSSVSLVEYTIYGAVFIFLIYRMYKARMRDVAIDNDYSIIGEFEGEFKPTEIQKKSLATYMKRVLKIGRLVKLTIALLVFVSYSIMFYFEESLDYVDYIGYIVIAIVLPIWLVMTKFKGE
jgi:hypothetical protein